MYNVIDVSKWQGKVDFEKLKKAGIFGVILKCASSANIFTVDPTFTENYENAKKAGLKVGCYFFSYDNTVSEADESAKRVANLLSGKQFELPVFYDFENGTDIQKSMTAADVQNVVRRFCKTLEDKGYFVGVYSYASLFETKLNYKELAKEFVIWVADYRESANMEIVKQSCMWQYTSKGRIDGVQGNVDMNYLYRDFEEIKSQGLNGFNSLKTFTATVSSGDLKRLEELANEAGKEFAYTVK